MTALERYLAEVKARAAAATAGPWTVDLRGDPTRNIGKEYWSAYVEGPPNDPGALHIPSWICQTFNAPKVGHHQRDAAFIAHARTDIEKLKAMVECARDRLNTLLNACEVCVGLNDTGSLRARATKAHIEDTFAELDRLARGER
jgi:hypothetical protein